MDFSRQIVKNIKMQKNRISGNIFLLPGMEI